jgi:hypothetical protein
LHNFARPGHIFSAPPVASAGYADDDGVTMERARISALLGLCIACAVAAAEAPLETFVIHAGRDGHEATIRIPVGAVSAFSATSAEAVVNRAEPQAESMHLRGDVRISVVGANQPIQIEADNVLLELTADETPGTSTGSRLEVVRRPRATEVIAGDGDTHTYVGEVIFTVPTSAGAMEISADRLEHMPGSAAGI